MEATMSYPMDHFGNCTECGGGVEGSIDHMEDCKYEENVNANLFAVRSLAFALLECRSEKEALQVLKYFARPKSPVPAPAKPVRRPDEPTEISK